MSLLERHTSDTTNRITSLGPTKIRQKSENNSKYSLKEETLGVT